MEGFYHERCIFMSSEDPSGSQVKNERTVVKSGLTDLASVAQLVGALSCKPKGRGFNSQPEHMPGLQVQFPVRPCARGNQSILSHIKVSIPLSLHPFPSL